MEINGYTMPTYVERNVGVPSIDGPDCEARVARHGAVNGALSQERAVDVVGCVAGDCPDHVRWICGRRDGIIREIKLAQKPRRWRGGGERRAF